MSTSNNSNKAQSNQENKESRKNGSVNVEFGSEMDASVDKKNKKDADCR